MKALRSWWKEILIVVLFLGVLRFSTDELARAEKYTSMAKAETLDAQNDRRTAWSIAHRAYNEVLSLRAENAAKDAEIARLRKRDGFKGCAAQ